jgi:hypothetical protein
MGWFEFTLKIAPSAALVLFAFWAGWRGFKMPPKD